MFPYMPKAFKLTKKNYYSKKNTYISNSKVSDFLVSKEYYKAKHIDGTLERAVSAPMQLGSMVDLYVSTGKASAILREFSVKVLQKQNPDVYNEQKLLSPHTLVSQELYDKALVMGKKIIDSPVYEWWKTHKAKFQELLYGHYDIHGIKVPVCGIADAVTRVGNTIYIDDIKTANASSMKNGYTWMRHCEEFGYMRQLANYRELLSLKEENEACSYVCRHVVIGSSEESWHPVKIFEFREEMLDYEITIFKAAAYELYTCTDFSDEKPSFDQAILLPESHETKI